MKFYEGTINTIIVDEEVGTVVHEINNKVIIPAEERNHALSTLLNMGQAMGRGVGFIDDSKSLFFRIVDLDEK